MIVGATTTLLGGRLVLAQPARGEGYRVNVDALLLARHALALAPIDHAMDLGAGVGAIGLALLVLGAVRRVSLIERDPHAAALARENAARHEGLADVREVDVRALSPDARVDLVVCNPPYTPKAEGREALGASRDAARRGDLDAFVAAAMRVSSRACFVYPAGALPSLLASASTHDATPTAIRLVHASDGVAARVALVTLERGRHEATIEHPWIERREGLPDADLERFLRGASSI